MKNKDTKYKIINEFHTSGEMSKSEIKMLFNQKLLKVILALEKKAYTSYEEN